MKKYFFLAVVTLGLVITSCNSNDDQKTNVENPIITPENPNAPVTVASEWEPATIQLIKIIPITTINYPHATDCTKDHLQIMSNNTAKFIRYTDADCKVTEYADAFTKNGNNVTVNVLGFNVSGTLEENSTQMIITSDVDAYIPIIKAQFPQYEQYLGMIEGGTVKLTLQKK